MSNKTGWTGEHSVLNRLWNNMWTFRVISMVFVPVYLALALVASGGSAVFLAFSSGALLMTWTALEMFNAIEEEADD